MRGKDGFFRYAAGVIGVTDKCACQARAGAVAEIPFWACGQACGKGVLHCVATALRTVATPLRMTGGVNDAVA